MRRPRHSTIGGTLARLLFSLLLGLHAPAPLLAQTAAPAAPPGAAPAAQATPGGGNVENDPIRCWWRSNRGGVRIGETFTVTLTCAVLESELVQVIPDESKLGHTVVQMTPFELFDGRHPADLHSGGRRFLQYEYDLRMINPDAIGTDVPVPLMQITYRVNSRIAGNQQMQGREMAYVLPVLWVKVLSLVPQETTDIRDTPDAAFGRIEAIQFRAGALETLAITLVALGGVMTLVALISIARRAAKTTTGPRERVLSRSSLMRLAVRELHAAQADGNSAGWSHPVISRALAALRVAAAGAIEKPVTQRVVDSEVAAGEGQFIMTRLGFGKRTAVSASVTSLDIARVLSRLPARAESRRVLLEELQQTLDALSSAQYSRPGADRGSLDAVVTKAIELARQVRSLHSWPREALRRLSSRAPLLQKPA